MAAVLALLVFGAAGFALTLPTAADPVRVVVETEMGAFFRTVHADNQPDDAIRIAVVQGGRNPGAGTDPFPPIALERISETGITHTDGAVSMARGGLDTATHSFFICIGDQPSLDFGGLRNPDGQGFAAFGRVVEGMEVVRAVHEAPYEAQSLTPPVRIERVYRNE